MDKNKRIFITGATGFIGSYILRYFLKKGYTNIVALKRKTSSLVLVQDIQNEVSWVEGDLSDFLLLEDIIAEDDIVIHTAAIVSMHGRDRKKMLKTNVEGTKNIVNAALHNSASKLLYISSVAALGKEKHSMIIHEEVDWSNDENTYAYAESKYLAELEVWRGKEEGLEVAMLNPGVVIGGGIWGNSSLKIITALAKGVPFYPVGSNGFVDVRDVARMTFALLEQEISGHRIIAVAENVKIKSVIDQICERLTVKVPTIKVNPRWIPFLGKLLTAVSTIFPSSSIITKATLLSTSQDWYWENKKSKKLLRFKYMPLKDSVDDMCDAYLQAKNEQKTYGLTPF